MEEHALPAKEPVSTTLAGPYGHPFHPILVTVPIGAWVASLVFDVGSHLVSRPGFLVVGSMWLIGLGVIGALLAALVGTMDLLVIPTGTRAFRIGIAHMALNLVITAAYVGNFLWRRAAEATAMTSMTSTTSATPMTAGTAPPVGTGPLVLSVVSLVALAVSGYLGGMLAYRYGVRVADEATQSEGYRVATSRTAVRRDARPAP